ncbi:MAG: DUF2764 family protein [Lentisphaerota bacterium]
MKHFYLVSSLPSLALGEPVPFSVEDFRFKCMGVLTVPELEELDLVLAGRMSEGESPFSRQWFSIDAQMRNAVARVRATRLGIDSKNFLKDHPGYSMQVEKSVTDAFAKATPLDRELELDHCRWVLLDDLTLQDAFGFIAVMAFAVKLQIAERWAALKDDVGRKRVETLAAQVKSQG